MKPFVYPASNVLYLPTKNIHLILIFTSLVSIFTVYPTLRIEQISVVINKCIPSFPKTLLE